MTPAEQLAAFAAFLATRPAPRLPQHPETGHMCAACLERDDWLESLAEQRAADRQWASDREADHAASVHFGRP